VKRRSQWSALREANRAIGGVVVFRFPEMEEIERAHASCRLRFPYVPGYLSFREIPVLVAALKKLKRMPDLLFCDGQGYAHPRRMGSRATWDFAGPADDWVREEHFDWDA